VIFLQEEIIGGSLLLKVIGIAFLISVIAFIILLRRAYKNPDSSQSKIVESAVASKSLEPGETRKSNELLPRILLALVVLLFLVALVIVAIYKDFS